MARKPRKVRQPRNWLAIHAHFRTGAGKHESRKSRGRARDAVDYEDYIDEICLDCDEEDCNKACKSESLVVE